MAVKRKEVNIIKQIHIPYDSNLRYLPLMYFLPENTIAKCPTLRTLPRKAREVLYDESMMKIVESDQFLNEIMDTVAALVFPHFGFGGWKEQHTGESPVYKLSYVLPIWAKLLEAEIAWGLQGLFLIPSTTIIPFFNPDYIKDVIGRIVKRAIEKEGWQPVLDVVKAMPCDEDFEKWNTNARKDFIRKWYHTRSKRVKMVSLEVLQVDEEKGVREIAADPIDIAEHVAAEDFVNRFKSRLSKRDMEILELRLLGFTHVIIADKLGYKNHSGVTKRLKAIEKAFIQYEEKYG